MLLFFNFGNTLFFQVFFLAAQSSETSSYSYRKIYRVTILLSILLYYFIFLLCFGSVMVLGSVLGDLYFIQQAYLIHASFFNFGNTLFLQVFFLAAQSSETSSYSYRKIYRVTILLSILLYYFIFLLCFGSVMVLGSVLGDLYFIQQAYLIHASFF